MSTPQAFKDIEENLSYLDDWESRYRYIIELGEALPSLAPEERNAENRVHGCVSQVWLVSERDGDTLRYRGESDAMIVRGLVAETDAIAIFDRLGLREHLSSQRSNGLVAMVNRIRSEARALA